MEYVNNYASRKPEAAGWWHFAQRTSGKQAAATALEGEPIPPVFESAKAFSLYGDRKTELLYPHIPKNPGKNPNNWEKQEESPAFGAVFPPQTGGEQPPAGDQTGDSAK